MKRRNFIQLSATGSLAGFMLNGHLVSAFTRTKLLNNVSEDVIRDRSIVMIQLSGGNDGLNTIIPKNQYDKYASIRPTIRIKNSGINAGIELDSSLSTADETLLHPNLTPFKQLWDDGKLNIVHGVGYPQLNKSHFSGRAIMSKGGDGSEANNNKPDGWMARYLHSGFDHLQYDDPLGIQLGNKKPADEFHSDEEHKVDINLSGQDTSGFYSQLSNVGNPIPDFGNASSEYIQNIEFINGMEVSATNYAQRISTVFNDGTNLVSYPPFDLADQLKTVAKMISGGSKTKIFLLRIDGFDNHANQVDSQNDSHLGKHADLLTELSTSIKAFQDDLEQLGIDENVVTTTFTEFGRKPIENGNKGTDHGNLGPMFVIGKGVNPGFTGTHLSLDSFTYGGNVKHFDLDTQMQHDYRQVYASIIGDFLGASSTTMIDTEFDDYDVNRLNLISSPILSNPYEKATNRISLTISPNPVENDLIIRFRSLEWLRGGVQVHDLQGRTVEDLTVDFSSGINQIPLNLSHLSEGLYVLKVVDDRNQTIATSKFAKQ
ncbi:MAG: hypothetical protein CMC80_06185 [Flavobacteriaceae bacterium]|nr:hypothetical protein [Flavobacteriaceae bacterium]|tara:strand:+ start:1580 stop:3211 length:1632 start_codon:yes stop_codon:yes gene_type:complete